MAGDAQAPAPAPTIALHRFNDGLVRRLFLRAPLATHGTLHVVCRRLKTLLRSPEFLRQRVESGLGEHGLIAVGSQERGGRTPDCSMFVGGEWRPIKPMSGRRGEPCSAIVEDEDGQPEMWVMGGGDGRSILATVEAYNPRTNTWRSCLPLSQGRAGAVAGVVGGRLVIAGGIGGGFHDGFSRLASVEAYTPTGWNPLPPLPHAVYNATACVLNGRLYVVGGVKPAKNKLQVLEMSEENKFTWTVKAAPPSQDEGAACAVVEGRLLSAGWSDRWGRTISVSIYDPASDSWSAGPALPHRKGLFDGFFKAAPYKAATHEGQVRLFSLRGPELAYRDGAWLRITGGLEFGVRVNVCDAFESVLLG